MDRSRLDFVPSGINTSPRDTAMARANKKPQLIEFKGTTLPVVSVTLYSLQTAPLTKAASELFGDDAFFDGDAAVLELDRIDLSDPANGAEAVNWTALRQLFSKHGLNVVGVRDGSEELRRSAAAADAPAELRLAAKQVTLTDAAGGAAVEVLYRMVRAAEKSV